MCTIIKSQLNRCEYFANIKHCLQCAWIAIPEIQCKKKSKLCIKFLNCLVSLIFSFTHSYQFWLNSRINYPFYDLSILSPPSPYFCLTVGCFPIISSHMAWKIIWCRMKHKMPLWGGWIVLELTFLSESKLACNYFYVISTYISQKCSMRRIFIQMWTISQWVKQAI